MTRQNLYDFTRSQLTAWLAGRGIGPAHAARLWRYLYRDLATDFAAMHDLPTRLRERLSNEGRIATLPVVRETHSDDELTRKYLLGLEDGLTIETVLMRPRDRYTACVSSQVGCAVGCVFCATGQAGFSRNLTPGEITAQAVFAAGVLRQTTDSVRNIVVMGMGEPLLNYDAVMTALDTLGDSGGPAIAQKRITVSTVGVVPGIVRLADEGRRFSLAVSLHSATQADRVALIPAARTWPLSDLIDACRYYTTKVGQKIFFEWTLIADVNDTVAQAEALAELLRGVPAQVNLIPLNTTAGYEGTTGRAESVERFRAALADHGIHVSIRQYRGLDIAAGCGQLAGTT